jgi:hypothetical protein
VVRVHPAVPGKTIAYLKIQDQSSEIDLDAPDTGFFFAEVHSPHLAILYVVHSLTTALLLAAHMSVRGIYGDAC